MTTDETAAPNEGTAGKAGPLAFDTSVAHQARMYDYILGGCFLYTHVSFMSAASSNVLPATTPPCDRGEVCRDRRKTSTRSLRSSWTSAGQAGRDLAFAATGTRYCAA
jgi:hypothetical protein